MKTTKLHSWQEENLLPYTAPEFMLHEFAIEKGFASSEDDEDDDDMSGTSNDSWFIGNESDF